MFRARNGVPRCLTSFLALAAVAILLLAASGPRRPAAEAQEAPSASAQARVAAARKGYEQALAIWRMRSGGSAGSLYWWSIHWLAAQRATSAAPADQVAAFQAHRDRMRALEGSQRAAAGAGLVATVETTALEYYRAEADYWHAEAARGKIPPPMP